MEPSYEFNIIIFLEMAFEKNPSWKHLKSMMASGVLYPIISISDEDHVEQLKFNSNRGNHPTCNESSLQEIVDFISDENSKDCIIPTPKEKTIEAPLAKVLPICTVT